MFKSLRNQIGASSLMVVMGTGGIIAAFILSLQMYVTARARVVNKIRLAYKYTFMMEDAAKILLNGRLEYLANCSLGACGCGAGGGKSAWDMSEAGAVVPVTICVPDGAGPPAERCLGSRAEACICRRTADESDNDCADLAGPPPAVVKNLELESADEKMVAFRSKEDDSEFAPAFEFSIFEKLIPDFDLKYIAFVERALGRKKSDAKFFNEAAAASNMTYTFTAAGTPLSYAGTAATAPLADATTDQRSPYPNSPLSAYTYRDCAGSRCITIRVCTKNTKEPALGTTPVVCFQQRIARSFTWDYASFPCGAAACVAGGATDSPVPGQRGTAACGECPWRGKF